MVADVCWRCFCHGGFWARPILRDWRKHCHLSWTRRCMNLIFLICHKFEKVFVPLFSLRSKFAAHYNVDLTFPSGQGESCISDKTPSLPCMVWRKRMSARHFQFMVRWNRRCKLSFWPQFSFCNHLSGGDFDLAGQFPNLEELRGDRPRAERGQDHFWALRLILQNYSIWEVISVFFTRLWCEIGTELGL